MYIYRNISAIKLIMHFFLKKAMLILTSNPFVLPKPPPQTISPPLDSLFSRHGINRIDFDQRGGKQKSRQKTLPALHFYSKNMIVN